MIPALLGTQHPASRGSNCTPAAPPHSASHAFACSIPARLALQGTGTVKVGGVKWEGKKVTFEEPEGGAEAEAAEETAAAGATGARLTAIGSCTQLDALGQQGAQQAVQQAAQQEDSGWAAQVKWKKIISAQLQGAEGQQLRLKQLQRQVVEAVLAKHSSLVSSKAAVKAAFAERLEGSSKFVVEGKLVRLRS